MRSRLGLAPVVWLILVCTLVLGQSRSGTIFGLVSDSAGAVIPGATVTVIEQKTNLTRVLTSDSNGRFLANLLPPGKYDVKVTSSGFKAMEVKDVLLEIEDNRELNFTLSPGSVETSTTITAESVEVQRADASLGQVVHERQVAD